MCFAFEKTRAKRVPLSLLLLLFGLRVSLTRLTDRILEERKRVLCVCWLTTFKSIVSTLLPLILIFLIAQLSFAKNCPRLSIAKSKKLSFSENIGNFLKKFYFFYFKYFKSFKSFKQHSNISHERL